MVRFCRLRNRLWFAAFVFSKSHKCWAKRSHQFGKNQFRFSDVYMHSLTNTNGRLASRRCFAYILLLISISQPFQMFCFLFYKWLRSTSHTKQIVECVSVVGEAGSVKTTTKSQRFCVRFLRMNWQRTHSTTAVVPQFISMADEMKISLLVADNVNYDCLFAVAFPHHCHHHSAST